METLYLETTIVGQHFEPRASLKDPKELYDGPLFILKRLVNNKWTKAFAVETAHADFVKPLNIDSQHRICLEAKDRLR
jgi:hypothetical protein